MAKMLKACAWFSVIMAGVAVVAGPRLAVAFLLAFVGLVIGLRNGYFRTISAEQFLVYDYHGHRRAVWGPAPPPPGHVIGEDWDPSPGLDFYYRTGEKAASLSVDSSSGQHWCSLALFRDAGRTRVGLAVLPGSPAASFQDAGSGTNFEIRLDEARRLVLIDGRGNRTTLG